MVSAVPDEIVSLEVVTDKLAEQFSLLIKGLSVFNFAKVERAYFCWTTVSRFGQKKMLKTSRIRQRTLKVNFRGSSISRILKKKNENR